ncbi:MAG: DUF2235 domain-containing protein [Pseudomonadales bacterium]|nr:DUF2235 domain-containing protein [Pseudomonadales bacterium]
MTKYIFCFDGTCNDPEDSGSFFEDTSISNVLKLHAFFGGSLNPPNIANPDMPDQRSFYYSGVGTRGNWLKQKFNAMFAPPEGDIEDILNEAKKDIESLNVQSEDDVYIFGFSRGAAIARMFASVIEQRVKFIGVFDTVAATKGSLDLNPSTFPASGVVFENGTIRSGIDQALHLISLDEKRLAFQPTLFNQDERVTEVWFPGVHSDIGGGYWFDGLSDITLKFMLNAVNGDLSILPLDSVDYERLRVVGGQDAICGDDLTIKPLPNGKLHEQQRAGLSAKTLSPRFVRVDKDDHPIRIDNDDQPKKQDVPVLHVSVANRFHTVTNYRPYALRNLKYRVMDEAGNIGEPKKGLADL